MGTRLVVRTVPLSVMVLSTCIKDTGNGEKWRQFLQAIDINFTTWRGGSGEKGKKLS
jgi:hypothetical protein